MDLKPENPDGTTVLRLPLASASPISLKLEEDDPPAYKPNYIAPQGHPTV